MSQAGVPAFGDLLRDWRAHRHVSQLALSTRSGISQRHISFLETGRSQPSRATVLALSDSLDIPLRERNALLHSAGFAAVYGDGPLDGASATVFVAALDAALAHHEPYPALLVDGRWNLVKANRAALDFFGLFTDVFAALDAIGRPSQLQIPRLCLRDEGLKPYIVNWDEIVRNFLARARRALLVNPRDTDLPVLIDEIVGHPDAPPALRRRAWSTPPAPAVAMKLTKDGETFGLYTMLAHFGAARHVTLEELSVETFYPADDATRRQLEAVATRRPRAPPRAEGSIDERHVDCRPRCASPVCRPVRLSN